MITPQRTLRSVPAANDLYIVRYTSGREKHEVQVRIAKTILDRTSSEDEKMRQAARDLVCIQIVGAWKAARVARGLSRKGFKCPIAWENLEIVKV